MMKTALTIRVAAPQDADCLSALAMRSKAHWGYSAEFMNACEQELAVTPEKILDDNFDHVVVENGATVMGFYALERLSISQFELEALFVEPMYMGQGVGRVLISHAKQSVIASGGSTLLIQSDPHAEGFYRKAGAQFLGWQVSASIPGRRLPRLQIILP